MNNTANAVPQSESLQPNGISRNGWMANGGDCVAAATAILVSLPFLWESESFLSWPSFFVVICCVIVPETYTTSLSACLFFQSLLPIYSLFFFLLLFRWVYTWIFYATDSRFSHWFTQRAPIYSLCSVRRQCSCAHKNTDATLSPLLLLQLPLWLFFFFLVISPFFFRCSARRSQFSQL